MIKSDNKKIWQNLIAKTKSPRSCAAADRGTNFAVASSDRAPAHRFRDAPQYLFTQPGKGRKRYRIISWTLCSNSLA